MFTSNWYRTTLAFGICFTKRRHRHAYCVCVNFWPILWDADVPDVGLHALSHPRVERPSTLAALGAQGHSHVVLLPVCNDNIAIFHDGRAFSLPVVSPVVQEPAEVAVHRLAEDMGLGDADIG